MSDHDKKDQAPDANRAPGQETPSRGYGRQVHEDDAKTNKDKTKIENGQAMGDDAQHSGSPSEKA